MNTSKESTVPSSRLSRLANFGALAFSLGTGAAAEVTRRAFNVNVSVFKIDFLLWGLDFLGTI